MDTNGISAHHNNSIMLSCIMIRDVVSLFIMMVVARRRLPGGGKVGWMGDIFGNLIASQGSPFSQLSPLGTYGVILTKNDYRAAD